MNFTARDFMLIEGADDFVELRIIAEHVGDLLRTDDPHRIRAATLAVLREAMEENLVEVGTLNLATGELDTWTCGHQEAIDRITREWHPLTRPLKLYEIACFRDTIRGKEIAAQLMASLRGNSS
jgi:hypothetical protein